MDFLVANFVIVLAMTYARELIHYLWQPVDPMVFIAPPPKSYTPFIEGLMAGTLMGVYILFRKNINMLSMVLGMWLYPAAMFRLYLPTDYGPESLIFDFSQFSMFAGIFCLLFHLARKLSGRIH